MIKSVQIDKYNVLNINEERELIKRYQENDDKQSLNTLICHNIKFIIHVINKRIGYKTTVRNAHFVKDDLMQECYFALVKAAENFDLNRPGIRFVQYARFWIAHVVQNYYQKNNNLVKNSEGDVFFDNQKFSGRDSTPYEGLSMLDKFVNTTVAKENFQCFIEPEEADTEFSIKKNQEALNLILASMKKRLSKQEISILSDRLMADTPLTLAEIGVKYNVSRERIRQIEVKLIEKLKNKFNEEGLERQWR